MGKVQYEHNLGSCCGCVPLKFCVIVYTVLVGILSVLALSTLVSESSRLIVGGYNPYTRAVAPLLGLFGIFCSVGCVHGIYENNAAWIRTFARYSLLRAVAHTWALHVDKGALRQCEFFASTENHSGRTSNLALTAVATSGTCAWTREAYFYVSVLTIIVSLAGAYHASRWSYLVDRMPRFTVISTETPYCSTL
eukprot:TRINITY_DN40332_c0_g1_i1.p1 TRINITY_DN40332_c0_g1~~TRINITY_DN40332_c0_g1_i1.p1  ORF type:complete len:194 (+),score=0.54 TRINITY_DN40332_c0_g1_i1:252-833(+)